MKKFYAILLMILLGLWLAGCDTNTSALDNDEAALMEAVENEYGDYFSDDVDFAEGLDNASDADFMFDYGFGKILSPIEPSSVIGFGRLVQREVGNDFPRKLLVRIEGDTAWVRVSRTLGGKFFTIEKLNQEGDTITVVRHTKDMAHYVEKTAVFVRRVHPDSANARGAWKLIAISGHSGKSRPFEKNTISLKKVTVINETTGEKFEYDNPLRSLKLFPSELAVLHRGDVVTIEVALDNATANPVELENGSKTTVLLHIGVRPKLKHVRRIAEFAGTDEEGNQIYRYTWQVMGMPFALHHFVVDAIDNGTIFDTDQESYPYNSTTWGFPYVVR